MEPANTLRFALSDRIDDVEVGPSHVPLGLLREFEKDVAEFLRGSGREVDPNQVVVSVEEGSLALVVSGLLGASGLWTDVGQLHDASALGQIDPRRADVVERWQSAARRYPNRQYHLADKARRFSVRIDATTDFHNLTEPVWVPVEKYLQGWITDLGGTNKANVHLRMDDGKTLTIASPQQLLADEEKNRLYRPALLHVAAEENLKTGELRKHTLISFEAEPPGWNEAEFARLVEKGTRAWEGVSDDWLEELRNGGG